MASTALYIPGTASFAPASYEASAPAALAADDPYPGPQLQSIDDEGWTQRYTPYGEQRSEAQVETDYRYTGQREEDGIGLYYYDARWYDPALGRFIQPDTIVPGASNTQALNRYSYVLNNPMKYTDPTGTGRPRKTLQIRGTIRDNMGSRVLEYQIQVSIGSAQNGIAACCIGTERSNDQTTSDLLSGRGYLSAGHLTAADAMMIVLRKAERMSQGNTRIFAEDTNAVLSGHNIDFLAYYRNRADGGVDNPGKSSPDYYATFVGSTGFASEYQDPNWENEQTHHFWFYVQLTYEYGPF
jgi:RHS repeat-associated protein